MILPAMVQTNNSALPSVAFVLPVRNEERILAKCLQTVACQDYPRELVSIIIADGGSTDKTAEISRSFGATVIDNPDKLAEPGVHRGMQEAKADIIFVMAADNGLPRPDWLRLMVRPFVERDDVIGAFTQIVHAPDDNSFTRYYCRLHVEPFTWFVYGAASNPRTFHRAYDVRDQGTGYVVYGFSPMKHPLIALAQAFGVRRSFVRRPGYEQDDILPIIQMIEDNQDIAYVPDAGVYHHHLTGFGQYMRKYRWRISNSLYTDNAGFNCRQKFLSPGRRFRKYLFGIYGLTLILPFLDGIWLSVREKDLCMMWHGPACAGLCWIILVEYAKKLLVGRKS